MTTLTESKTYTYTLDPAHTAAHFSVRHLMVAKVRGTFPKVSGSVTMDPKNPQNAVIHAEIDMASVATGVEQRDAHLRTSDFFDVDHFPTMEFHSTRVVPAGGGEFDVVGNLTLRGVTREVTLRAEVTNEVPSPFGGYKVGVTATGTILREEFGVSYNQVLEAGGVAVGKEVAITIEAELDRS